MACESCNNIPMPGEIEKLLAAHCKHIIANSMQGQVCADIQSAKEQANREPNNQE